MKQLKHMSKKDRKELDGRIASFMERKMEIFPELRHQPEMVIEEASGDKMSFGQRLRAAVTFKQSIRS